MIKTKLTILLVFSFFLLLSINALAKENPFGSANAWVELNDGQWQKAGLDDVVLKVNEPFYVKVNISTKVVCTVSFEIYGPGKTVTYMVLNGPSSYHETIVKYNCPIGWNETFEWIVCPTNNWTEGFAALNLRIQFSRWNEKIQWDENGHANFGLINAYISPDIWNGTLDNESNKISSTNKQIPGFELIILFIAIILVLINKSKLY